MMFDPNALTSRQDAARMRRRWMDQTIPNNFGAVSAPVTNRAICLGFVDVIIGRGIRTEVPRGAFGEERILEWLNAVSARHNVVVRGLEEDFHLVTSIHGKHNMFIESFLHHPECMIACSSF